MPDPDLPVPRFILLETESPDSVVDILEIPGPIRQIHVDAVFRRGKKSMERSRFFKFVRMDGIDRVYREGFCFQFSGESTGFSSEGMTRMEEQVNDSINASIAGKLQSSIVPGNYRNPSDGSTVQVLRLEPDSDTQTMVVIYRVHGYSEEQREPYAEFAKVGRWVRES